MSKGRKQKKEQAGRQKSGWLTLGFDLLRGAVLGFAVSCVVLGITSLLVYSGLIGHGKVNGAIVAACLVGAFTGGMFVVKRAKKAPLPFGLGAGGMLFLVLLAMGSMFYDVGPEISLVGVTASACLCGGGLAGFAGGMAGGQRRK